MRGDRTLVVCLLLLTALVSLACDDDGTGGAGAAMPDWVESVYPEPGTTLAVPDAVEVDHTLQRLSEDVRLVVDGTDVTTYATFEAGKIRYESGAGPVELDTGHHTAQVQRVRLRAVGADYEILDSFEWEFRTG